MNMSEVKPLVREALLEELRQDPLWDVVVIGGGATGVGIAVDAASRGLKTVLLEAQDFAAGTSSRSTKLIHGGVRYMKNPRDWGLVREALKERRTRTLRTLFMRSPSFCRPTRSGNANTSPWVWASTRR